MAVSKLSAITASGSALASGNQLVGVTGGNTDALFSAAQVATFMWASPTITGTPTGNIVASFNSRTGAVSLTTGDVTTALAFTPLNPANNLSDVVNAATARVNLGVPAALRSYIAGLTLSNDGGTPNSVLDIAAGTATDSTNAATITLGAFTKSTAGSWVAGTGNNGMGTGLTIANSTWYHVFAIINAGVADVYFDTSVTAANKPASTTAFRRIGSFLTDGTAHILAFTQVGETTYWGTVVQDLNNYSMAVNPGELKTLTVPTGVAVRPILRWAINNGSAHGVVQSPNETAITPGTTLTGQQDIDGGYGGTSNDGASWALYTNTAAQLRIIGSASSSGISVWTRGWIDDRGKFN